MSDSSGGLRVVFLDLFGTLVAYDPDEASSGEAPRNWLRERGATASDEALDADFASRWARARERATLDDSEFSQEDVAEPFLGFALGRAATNAEVRDYCDVYTEDWQRAVRPVAGLTATLEAIGAKYPLILVSNIHYAPMARSLLDRAGVLDAFVELVTSVEVGWVKPHPAIFARALEVAGVPASAAVHVGDSPRADYEGATSSGIRGVLIGDDASVPERDRIAALADLPEHLGV